MVSFWKIYSYYSNNYRCAYVFLYWLQLTSPSPKDLSWFGKDDRSCSAKSFSFVPKGWSVLFGDDDWSCSDRQAVLFGKDDPTVMFGKDVRSCLEKEDRSCSEKTIGLVRQRHSVLFGKDDCSCSEKTFSLVRRRRSVLFGKTIGLVRKGDRSCSAKTFGLVGKDDRSRSEKAIGLVLGKKVLIDPSHCIDCGWECKHRSHNYFGLISLVYI